jgi:hypothetical protein
MKNVMELHESLTKAGCGGGQELRKHGVGDWAHQGDVYLIPIKSRPAVWSVETTQESRQIAVGQGEGSNHRVTGNVRVYWPESAQKAAESCPIKLHEGANAALLQVLGPVIEADEAFQLTHPKHAHHELPAGVYLTVYQLDRRTMRRVQD